MRMCLLGVGCEAAGQCYAEWHQDPSNCGMIEVCDYCHGTGKVISMGLVNGVPHHFSEAICSCEMGEELRNRINLKIL